jgi:hypothetical protein
VGGLVAAGTNAALSGAHAMPPQVTQAARGLCAKTLTLLADVEAEASYAAAGAGRALDGVDDTGVSGGRSVAAGADNFDGAGEGGRDPVPIVRVDVDATSGARTATVIQGSPAAAIRGVPVVGGPDGGAVAPTGASGSGSADVHVAAGGLLRRLREVGDQAGAAAFCDVVRAATSACSAVPPGGGGGGDAEEGTVLVAAEAAAASARAWTDDAGGRSGLQQACGQIA